MLFLFLQPKINHGFCYFIKVFFRFFRKSVPFFFIPNFNTIGYPNNYTSFCQFCMLSQRRGDIDSSLFIYLTFSGCRIKETNECPRIFLCKGHFT